MARQLRIYSLSPQRARKPDTVWRCPAGGRNRPSRRIYSFELIPFPIREGDYRTAINGVVFPDAFQRAAVSGNLAAAEDGRHRELSLDHLAHRLWVWNEHLLLSRPA